MAQFGKKGTTRALVVGISEYQDEGIPDLRFAHRDAQAFADYLLERPVDRVRQVGGGRKTVEKKRQPSKLPSKK